MTQMILATRETRTQKQIVAVEVSINKTNQNYITLLGRVIHIHPKEDRAELEILSALDRDILWFPFSSIYVNFIEGNN